MFQQEVDAWGGLTAGCFQVYWQVVVILVDGCWVELTLYGVFVVAVTGLSCIK